MNTQVSRPLFSVPPQAQCTTVDSTYESSCKTASARSPARAAPQEQFMLLIIVIC